MLLFKSPVKSQDLVLDNNSIIYQFDKHLSLALDYTNSSDSSFPKIDLDYSPLKTWNNFESERTYWGKVNIQNNASQELDWVLKFPLVTTDIEVYVIDKAGNIQKGSSGFFKPIKERTFAPIVKGNLVQLNLKPSESYEVYCRMQFERPADLPLFDIDLILLEKFWTDLNKSTKRNSIYLGFVLMMLIYNLILFLFTRDKAFIYYSVYLFGAILFIVYNEGALADWITGQIFPVHPQYIHFFKLFIYIAIIGYLTFIRTFVDLKKLLPSWDTIFKWLSILAVFAFFLDAFLMAYTNFSYNVADHVSLSFAALFVGTIFTFTIPLFRLKDKKNYFIVFGIIAMGLGTLSVIWLRLQTVDFSTHILKIGSVLEIIAFSLGLAYRRLLSEKEKQKARFELVKSKLIQEQEQKEAERLKELDSLKSRLYTNITHEFRTPLTVIMGISKELKASSKAKELIQRNSQQLLQLINQMLDLAKAEEGKLQLNLVQKDIIVYLRYLTESFLSAAETKNIRLTFYTETESCEIPYDEDKVLHIVQNLLSNAIKFTPPYGTVVFHVKTITKEEQAYIQLKVKDSGIGISKEELPNIFDRFYQSDNTSTRKEGGTGIGLALVKELVHLMEGKIEVFSELGKGSELVVQIPIKEEMEGVITTERTISAELETLPQEIVEDIPITQVESIGQMNQVGISTIQDVPLSKEDLPLLLIIEDNPDVLSYIQTCLVKHYSIEVARNGKEGIEKAFDYIPDIIISDVMMPEKDGFEVTQTLKQDHKTSHIPIILLTAKATQENKLMGLKHGADAYLLKPFDKEELVVRLEKLIALRNRLQEYYSGGDFELKKQVTKMTNSEEVFIEDLTKIIEDHLTDSEFSVPQIATIMNMSQVQVYRKLKALTGKTPSQYIRFTRMKKAMDLLKTTQLNISEIAYDLGFSDPNYFSRTFQQIYGQTPSSIRKG